MLYDNLFKANEDLKTVEDLLKINVSAGTNHKSSNCVEIDTKARLHFNECILLAGDKALEFHREWMKFYSTAVAYLVKNWLVDSGFIKYAQYCIIISKTSIKVQIEFQS